jgi:hypothetical protein
MNISKSFILAAKGNLKHSGSIFTLEIPKDYETKHNLGVSHYTYKIKYRLKENRDRWYVYVLTGPNNLYDYTYIGELNPNSGEYVHLNSSKIKENAWSIRFIKRILACMWEDKLNDISKNNFDLHHEGRCGRCGKKLTVPSSILSGLGPICENLS